MREKERKEEGSKARKKEGIIDQLINKRVSPILFAIYHIIEI